MTGMPLDRVKVVKDLRFSRAKSERAAVLRKDASF